MPKEPNPFQRYVDLGMALTEEARRRAEEIFRELAREGEAGRAHATERVGEAVDKSRKTAEQFVELVRDEVRRQLQALDLTNRDDVIAMVQRVADTLGEARDKIVDLLGEAGGKVSGATEKAARVGKDKLGKGHAAELESSSEDPTPGASFAKKAAERKAAAQKAPAKKAAPAEKAEAATPAEKAAPAKKAAASKAAPAKKATGRAPAAKKATGSPAPEAPAADE